MKNTHHGIWSAVRETWVAPSDISRSSGKSTSIRKGIAGTVSTTLMATLPLYAHAAPPAPNALPTGGQVVSGQASIAQSGAQMTINQATNKAILNWNTFNIGGNATVTFQQPSSSAVALNRVTGADPSAIYGKLNANGQVFLTNPNGVLFAPGSHVDVGGLVASTLNISNADFLAGNNRFTRDGSTGSVVNQGELFGKYVALLAPEVRNEGVIAAHEGTVALAAGDAVTLGITGNSLIDVQVDKASINTLVENKQMVQAGAGTVIMSAQSANQLLGQVVNSGTVEANGITADGGVIRLRASSTIANTGTLSADAAANGKGGSITAIADLTNSNSLATVDGTLSAKGGSQSGDGGFIETSGHHLTIADTALIDTSAANGQSGNWLLDPVDFTIAAAGGDITGAALATALGTSNITIQTATGTNTATNLYGSTGTNGDIFVNDSVSWASNKSLTLNAWRNIEINAPISVNTSGGGLNLQFAQSDLAGNIPFGTYLVNAPVNLAAGTTFTTKYGSDGAITPYTVILNDAGLVGIGSNLAGNYVLGTSFAATTNPWVPLGNAGGNVTTATQFTGVLDGLGHTISNLTNTNTANQTGVGLFGSIGTAGMVQNLGLLYVSMAGLNNVGALAGENNGAIYNVYATGAISGSDTAVNVNSVGAIGGLIGHNFGSVSNVYAAVTVTASNGVQATGGTTDGGIGGLVGVNGGAISNAYATGNVTGIMDVGGFAGWTMGSIGSAYATGTVTGTTNAGGFLGTIFNPSMQPLLFDTYWSQGASGQATSASDTLNTSTDLTSFANMKLAADYAPFDFTHTWVQYDAVSTPMLMSMLTPFIVTATNQSKTYDGQTFTASGGSYTAVYSMATPGTVNTAGLALGGAATTATNAGSYAITPSGVTLTNNAAKQDQHGYYIRFVDGSLTINKAILTVTADPQSRLYGAANPTFTETVSGYVNGENATSAGVTGSATGSSLANAITPVGTATITASAGTLSATNYDFTNLVNGTLTINPASGGGGTTPTPTPTPTTTTTSTPPDAGQIIRQTLPNAAGSGTNQLNDVATNNVNTKKLQAWLGGTTVSGKTTAGTGTETQQQPIKATLGGTVTYSEKLSQKSIDDLTDAVKTNTKALAALTTMDYSKEIPDSSAASKMIEANNKKLWPLADRVLTAAFGSANIADIAEKDLATFIKVQDLLLKPRSGSYTGEVEEALKIVNSITPVPRFTVSAETNLPAGTEVTVTFKDGNGNTKTAPAKVGQDGSVKIHGISGDNLSPPVTANISSENPKYESKSITLGGATPPLSGGGTKTPAPGGTPPSPTLAVGHGISDISVNNAQSLLYSIPKDTFVASSQGVKVTLEATLADGSPLPSWLHFYPDTGTITGMPPGGQWTDMNIKINAIDDKGNKAATTLKVNAQHSPKSSGTAPTPAGGSTSSTTQNTGGNGNSSAGNPKQTGQSTATQTTTKSKKGLPGLPTAVGPQKNVVIQQATLGGIVPSGSVTSTTPVTTQGTNFKPPPPPPLPPPPPVTVTVATRSIVPILNNAPPSSPALAVDHGIGDFVATPGQSLIFTIPRNAFASGSKDAQLTYKATLVDGTPLPAWMHFNAATGTFSGTAPAGEHGNLNIKVNAVDDKGNNAVTTFKVTTSGSTPRDKASSFRVRMSEKGIRSQNLRR